MSFPVERIKEIETSPEDFRLVERVPITKQRAVGEMWDRSALIGDEVEIVVLDCETTGFDCQSESIIELGMVKILFSPSAGVVSKIEKIVSMYEQPSKPIPEIITQITGIDDSMVDGTRFDEALVNEYLGSDPLVIAHNAKFDRGFFENRFPQYANLRWACSIKDVNWRVLGFEGNKLEYLLLKCGYFYEGHRASIDCLALIWLFICRPESIRNLLRSAEKTNVLVRALASPYRSKDLLSNRKYTWDDGTKRHSKHWWKEIDIADVEKEQAFLASVYDGEIKASYERIDARGRYKADVA